MGSARGTSISYLPVCHKAQGLFAEALGRGRADEFVRAAMQLIPRLQTDLLGKGISQVSCHRSGGSTT